MREDEKCVPPDESQKKSLTWVERFERLYQTDEKFRQWCDEGWAQKRAGRCVVFDENGWHEVNDSDACIG